MGSHDGVQERALKNPLQSSIESSLTVCLSTSLSLQGYIFSTANAEDSKEQVMLVFLRPTHLIQTFVVLLSPLWPQQMQMQSTTLHHARSSNPPLIRNAMSTHSLPMGRCMTRFEQLFMGIAGPKALPLTREPDIMISLRGLQRGTHYELGAIGITMATARKTSGR